MSASTRLAGLNAAGGRGLLLTAGHAAAALLSACGLWAAHISSPHASREDEALLRSFAEQQQMSESAVLKQIVDLAMRGAGAADADLLKSSQRRIREARTSVRLHPDDE